jgi:hypothetical protein
MEDFPRDYPGVWKDIKFSSITPQHVGTGEEGHNRGVDTINLLRDNVGYTYGGPGVA